MPDLQRQNENRVEFSELQNSPSHPINRDRLVIWFSYALAIWGPVFAVIFWWLGSTTGTLSLFFATIFVLLTPTVLKRTRSRTIAGNYLAFCMFTTLLFLTLITGGHGSAASIWNVAVPIFAAMLVGLRSAILWTTCVIGQFIAFYFLDRYGIAVPQHFTPTGMRLLDLTGMMGLTVLVLSLAVLFEYFRRVTNEALDASNRAKSEFLANMSHELRTPMTAILGFAELLSDNVTEPQSVDAVQTIQRNGTHLLGLINNILDLSKVEAGKMPIETIPCSPRRIITDVVATMRVPAEAKSLALEVEYRGQIPETIQSDPTRLRQILVNIISNAIKFTENGSVRVVASLRDEDSAQPEMQLEVTDTGIGMTAEQLEQVFNPFAQADNSTTRVYGGTGLGLTICRRLCELLGGKIHLTSVPELGTTVVIRIPTGQISTAPLETESHTIDRTTTPLDDSPLSSRILVADDGPDNRRLISFLLKKMGADVAVVENGRIALDRIDQAKESGEPFDLVFMDMQMPVLDGYAATKKLRENGYGGPIIALTAHAMKGDEEKCLAAGCDDYFTKPINRSKLEALVRKYLCRDLTHNPGIHDKN